MAKFGPKREFDNAKSDRQLFFSVFKENNAIFDSDPQFFGIDPPSYWNHVWQTFYRVWWPKMTKLGQKREFDYAKSDRLLFFSVFKENNEFFDSDTHLFGLEPPR